MIIMMSSPTPSSSFTKLNRCKSTPISLSSQCSCNPNSHISSKDLILRKPNSSFLNLSSKDLVLSKPNSSKFRVSCKNVSLGNQNSSNLRLKLFLETPKCIFGGCNDGFVGSRRLVAAVGEIYDQFDDAGEEVNKSNNFSLEDQSDLPVQKVNQLQNRIIFGIGIGISVGGIVLAGGWVFTVALAAAVFTGSREYFELVRSRGIAAGMTPPPRYLSRVCSVFCALMPILTLYFGHIDVSVTSAAFVVAMALLLQRGMPRFSQLSSTMFGLFYCGYLPCFWVKLRCGLAAPSLYTIHTACLLLFGATCRILFDFRLTKCSTGLAAAWPALLGGHTQWTVGLVATLISISSIVAADTYAFFGGKAFGRTPLTVISPKKTWEGALAGLGGCILTTLLLSKILCWPSSAPSAIAFGFLNFFGSLFGDLIESMIKRDAGVKDSGSLIPGHGGVLDRVDSYMFTGALAYSFVKTFLPLYGV